MTTSDRPSVCYVVPGHHLLTTAGPTRNVLSLARALSDHADVTVAFRSVVTRISSAPFRIVAIDPEYTHHGHPRDDAAVRGVTYREFWSYLRTVRRFAEDHLRGYDLVLEKSWLLSGYVSDRCRRLGVPAIAVENVVPVLGRGARRGPLTVARHWIGRRLAGRYLRRSAMIVAETEYLRQAIVARWGIAPEKVEVIGLGVDRVLFRPADQADARAELGIDPKATVLLYVGVLDRTHDLAPLLDALRGLQDRRVHLHVVGDGVLRVSHERRAAGAPAVHFHGPVPHRDVPRFIAAADLCVAPYDPAAFPDGAVGYSTLKIREYLSAGRPVASVSSGSIPELITHRSNGFLLDNDEAAWHRLLADLPSREALRDMGRRAATSKLDSWEDVAAAYRALCDRVIAADKGSKGEDPSALARRLGGVL